MKKMLLLITTLGMGFVGVRLFKKKDAERKQRQRHLEKLTLYYHMLCMWLEMKQKGKSVVTFLQRKGIKKIAIYGMKEFGERFYDEIQNTEIEVVCVIDRNPDQILGDFKVISPEQLISDVDAIVVTANYDFPEIKKQLETKVNCPIYSLGGVMENSVRRFL